MANWAGASNKPDFLRLFCFQVLVATASNKLLICSDSASSFLLSTVQLSNYPVCQGGFDSEVNCLSGRGEQQSAEWAAAVGLMSGMLQVGALCTVDNVVHRVNTEVHINQVCNQTPNQAQDQSQTQAQLDYCNQQKLIPSGAGIMPWQSH